MCATNRLLSPRLMPNMGVFNNSIKMANLKIFAVNSFIKFPKGEI